METRSAFIEYIQAIKNQTLIEQWSLANERIITANILGAPIRHGKYFSVMYKLMNFIPGSISRDVILFFSGMYKIHSLRKKLKIRQYSFNQNGMEIFAGFGANSEEYLYASFFKKYPQKAFRVNWVTGQGFSCFGIPSWRNMILMLFRYSFGYTSRVKSSIKEISNRSVNYLAVCATNIGEYVFFKELWGLARLKKINRVTFLAPSLAAFACVDVGIKTVFHQHGMLGLGILFPDFDQAEMITQEEIDYLKPILPKTTFKKIENSLNIPQLSECLMILSVNGVDDEDTKQRIIVIKSIVEWARIKQLSIVIRPTKSVTQQQCQMIQDAFPDSILNDTIMSLDASYEKWRPKYVASWNSTGLVTALDFGATSISFCDPEKDASMLRMIYPFEERVLFWSRDRDKLL